MQFISIQAGFQLRSHLPQQKLMSAFTINNQERQRLPTETVFFYTGKEPYLSMEEYTSASDNEQCLCSHFILDQQLSIIWKKKKELIRLPNTPLYEEEPLVTKIEVHQPPLLFQKVYQKYCQLDDFVFGRQHWGRTINCLKIPSDLISRKHARLSVNNLTSRQTKEKMLQSIKKVVSDSHYSSLMRKVPLGLWKKVVEYADFPIQYKLRDCGSRNGTFLMNFSHQQVILRNGEGYEFDSRDYIIYVNQILKTSGPDIVEKMNQFFQHWKRQQFYNPHYICKIICPKELIELLPTLKGPVYAVNFLADFNHELKYFFWVITTSQNETYGIGEGQVIAVSGSPEQPYESGRHGSLHLRNGTWSLEHGYARQRIWVKLPAQTDYLLNPANRYRIRLGHINIVGLTFHNFS